MDKIERKEIKLMGVLPIEVYRLPRGEFKISMASASIALGYADNQLSRTTSLKKKTFKQLQGKGFTGYLFEVSKISRATKRGASTAKTISIDDFDKLLEWAEEKGSKKAQIIAKTYTRAARKRSTIDDIKEAFEEEKLTVDERRKIFYQEFAKSLSESDWFDGDRNRDLKLVAELEAEGWQPQVFLKWINKELLEAQEIEDTSNFYHT